MFLFILLYLKAQIECDQEYNDGCANCVDSQYYCDFCDSQFYYYDDYEEICESKFLSFFYSCFELCLGSFNFVL